MNPIDQSRLFPAKIGQFDLMHALLIDLRRVNSNWF